MDKNHAIVEQDGHVLIITLNRPEKRNALSPGMLAVSYTHLTLPTKRIV